MTQEQRPAARRPAAVLVVDDEADMRQGLAETLRAEGHEVDTAGDGWQALERARERAYDVALVDLRMPGPDGLLVLDGILRTAPETEVVVITAYATVESAVAAMKVGAADYLPKPFKLDQLRLVVERAAERKRLRDENRRLRREVEGYRRHRIVGQSAAMGKVLDAVARVAPTGSTVLIVGETGTGKELVARAVHQGSPRAAGPFVAFSCGAVAEGLLESQLYGHVRGAFTGATEDREGVFEAARGGTLFLDEIGDVPPAMQVRLLRVLQEREIQRLGETRPRPVDVRLVAATHRDLAAEVRAGRFREDLYYRLEVARVEVPPLRQRREDIPLLARHFLEQLCREMGRPLLALADDAVAALTAHDWPGNVRELGNAVERALLFHDGSPALCARHLTLGAQGGAGLVGARVAGGMEPLVAPGAGVPAGALPTMREMERRHIQAVLAACGNNQTLAAQALGIGRRTLYRKVREYGIQPSDRASGLG